MDPSLKLLFDYGHHANPKHPNTVTGDSLKYLVGTEDDARAMVTSYQEFFCEEISELCKYKYHGRALIVDGELGPATIEVLNAPRCGMPDYGTYEANWPEHCRNPITTSYSMNLSGINNTDMQNGWLEALRNWDTPLTDMTMSLQNTNFRRTDIWAAAKSLQSGVLAWSYLANNNCASKLEQAYNNRISWSLVLFITTVTHEIGHALGSGHLRDRAATMYPSITQASLGRRGKPNSSDLENMERLGYRVGEPGPPPPPPPPPQGELEEFAIEATIKTSGAGEWKVRLTP